MSTLEKRESLSMIRDTPSSSGQQQICVLCGENRATTRDHIPPKGIYPRPLSKPMILHTVPACAECNNQAGVEDEEFKIVMGFLTGEFRENQNQLINSMAKTIGSNRRLANQVFSTKQAGYAQLYGSLFEPAVRVTFHAENYSKVLERIVRGLYWSQTGRILEKNVNIRVIPLQAMAPEFLAAMKQLMHCLKTNRINQDTFAYKVYFMEDSASIWGMQFFRKHAAFAYAKPLDAQLGR